MHGTPESVPSTSARLDRSPRQCLVLLPTSYATITNAGQVFVGSNLTIASTVDGSRTVDAQADGPVGTITVGNGFVGPRDARGPSADRQPLPDQRRRHDGHQRRIG